jgi:RNA polymerase sigma-70 factor, ECF subfamily
MEIVRRKDKMAVVSVEHQKPIIMTSEQRISYAVSWVCAPGQEVYEALVSPNLHLLRRWVKRRVPRGEDADDIIQQTLLLAFRHMGQFRFEASFGTWLCRIAINEIRGRARRPEYKWATLTDPRALENSELHDPRPSPLAVLERKDANVRLHRAIAKLPETYRVVVELRDLCSLTVEETAESLRMTKSAVKSRHHRARGLLLKFLNGQGGGSRDRQTY